MSIRQKIEAEQAALDYVSENWQSAKGRSANSQEVLENALESTLCLLNEMAKSNPFVAIVLRQRADTLREKRLGRKAA